MLYFLCLLVIVLIPGVYVSANKYILHSFFPQYNHFAVRFILMAPMLACVNFVISIFLWMLPLWLLFPETVHWTPPTLIGPVLFGFLLIFGLRKYLLLRDGPEIHSRCRYDYEFYLYYPDMEFSLTDSKINGTKFERVYKNKVRPRGAPPIERQLTETIVSYHEIKGKNMAISIRGDLIISEKGIDILRKNQITGYQTAPVRLSFAEKRTMFTSEHSDDLKYEGLNGERYFRILSTSTLPPMSPKTKYIVKEGLANWSCSVPDSTYYYRSNDLVGVCDINDTNEYFIPGPLGAYIQKFRVISKKMKQLMISDFSYTEEDFLPIYLVDENDNVIDQSKKSGTS